MSGFVIEQPLWLALAVGVVPLAVVAGGMLAVMTRARFTSALIFRFGLLLLAGVMLSGASTVRSVERLAVVAVVDVSDSVQRYGDLPPMAAMAAAQADTQTEPADVLLERVSPGRFAAGYLEVASDDRRPDDLVGIVAFGARPFAVALPSAGEVFRREIDGAVPAAAVEGSDLGLAIEQAAAMIPPDATGRLLLVSDGNETRGGALDAARRLASRGIPIDVVPVPYRVGPEVLIERLDAPESAARESTVRLRVTLHATAPTRGELRVSREGEPVDINGAAAGSGRALVLQPGRRVEFVDVRLDAERLHRFEAVFEPERNEPEREGLAGVGPVGGGFVGDTVAANNRAEAFTLSPGRGRVLFIDGVDDGAPGLAGTALARSLAASGIDVEVLPPGGLPGGLLGLQSYDLVVLSNIAADEVDAGVQANLETYVRDLGGGLVFLGGRDAFGAGGWKGSRLEALMPVELDLPERLVVPEAAIMIVLDSSGSMRRGVLGSARSQQEIANESAARAIKTLDATDLVGVLEFNEFTRVVQPLEPNRDADRTADRVREIVPGGGTNLVPALRNAQRQMRGAEAKVKHVIVLTDGQSQDAELLPGVAAELYEQGVRVSTIGVGDESDDGTLQAMADAGKGAFYSVVNPNVLPRVFLKAIRVVRSPLVREVPFEPVLLPTGSPLLNGVSGVPLLDGLVLTQALESDDVVNAIVTPGGEPVLAHWRVGLGQVAAFTSDAHMWGERWLAWDGYGPFWSQLVRTLSRAQGDAVGELRAVPGREAVLLRYEAIDRDGRSLERLSVPVSVYGPSGEREDVRLRQTAPGVYEGTAAAAADGTFVAVATPSDQGRRLAPALAGATVSAGREHARLAPDRALLDAIAEATGGRVLSPAGAAGAALFDRAEVEPREARTPLWPLLLAWLPVLFLLDVGTRRVAWDRFVSREFGASMLADARVAIENRGRPAAARAEALRGTSSRLRERVQASRDGAELNEGDAARSARDLAVRRAEAERERLRAVRASAARSPAGGATGGANGGQEQVAERERDRAPERDAGAGGDGGEEESGLMAAKRRARERFDA